MKSIFQQDNYYSFLSGTGFLKPFRFTVSRDGRAVGILQGYIQQDGGCLKRYLSKRAVINGGPFFVEDIRESEVKELLEKCINELKEHTIYIEIRNFHDYSRFRTFFEECGFIYEPHYDFMVNTESLEAARCRLGKSRRRDIRTSLRDGASVVDNPTDEQIIAFYSILDDLYKTRVKTPLFPLDFFIKLNRELFSIFLLIECHDEIIGGTVCVFDDDTVYEWFACGKDNLYKSIFPSTLATWSGIKFAAESGRKQFDMMGAGAPGDGGYGVRDFKAKFGGELVEYGRFKYLCNRPLYRIGKLGISIIKKLK